MQARIKWVENCVMLGHTDSGHTIVMDGPPAFGGNNFGARPMELLLLGMGGCTQFDVLLILRRARQAVTDCVVEITAERASTDPKVFTQIHVHFIITGQELNPRHVERAIKLSAEKYCSAAIMLGATATITHDYEIRRPDPAVLIALSDTE
ncbi:OsmC family protein [Rhodoferax sp. 4810]|uniref:OsmC family protein n=1 Tax=Thiospirillum jenense TaxID=1653858 RepID=A0A839H9R3_9GAMM|nr:OsmC family protein [Thiospirillum jenense]MBB1073486.1 OsmC family protein [Rhodoferax jenense]MBB1125973.1 OsmC family protein [Thiospirillum jenense]